MKACKFCSLRRQVCKLSVRFSPDRRRQPATDASLALGKGLTVEDIRKYVWPRPKLGPNRVSEMDRKGSATFEIRPDCEKTKTRAVAKEHVGESYIGMNDAIMAMGKADRCSEFFILLTDFPAFLCAPRRRRGCVVHETEQAQFGLKVGPNGGRELPAGTCCQLSYLRRLRPGTGKPCDRAH